MMMRQRPLSASLRHLLSGGAALLLCAPLPALADQAATTTPPKQASKPDTHEVKQLGAITVTAQSRAQEMQDVPIALQIVTAKQVDTLAATDISKMDIFVPGLVVSAGQPTQPSYALRGIGGSGFGIGTEPAVGVYVDGVYAARSGGALLAFNDIKRIEVLKGPQGTLFGRNSAAGAISIITNEPGDTFEAKGTFRYGAYGERYGDVLLNVPLNQDMALRFSVLDNQSDGWARDSANGKHYGGNHDWGTRAQYRWNITPNTRVLLAWDHEQLKQAPQAAYSVVPLSSYVPRPSPLTGTVPPFPADPKTWMNPLHAPLYGDAVGAAETRRFNGVTLTVDHSFGWGSFTSTTAWRNFDTYNLGDYDGTNQRDTYLDTANIEHNNSWYQEFKLTGNTDLIDWVAGTSFYHEQARQISRVDTYTDSLDTLGLNSGSLGPTDTFAFYNSLLPLVGYGQYTLLGDPWREEVRNDENINSYAVYGDVIWHLTDRLNLTTGARYTLDQKQFSWFNPPRYAPQLDTTLTGLAPLLQLVGIDPSVFQQNQVFNTATGAPVNVLAQARNNWRDFSPRVVLDYHFTPNIMAYGSVTRGYKAGGYNMLEFNSHYSPEHVVNYEGGIKTVFPEQNLLLNVTAYYYTYKNLQALVLKPATAGTNGIPEYVTSTSDQHARGLEVELQWAPTDGLRLGLNGAFINSTYTRYIAPDGNNLAGQPTGTPIFSGAASLSYTLPHVFNGSLVYDASYGYRGKSRCNSDSQLQGNCQVSPNFTVGSARQSVDMRLDWNAPGSRWGVGVFVTNLLNKRYVTGVDNTAAPFGLAVAHITPPRMWGVELRAKL